MAYLNGKKVSNDSIDPTKHKFVGKFRLPSFDAFQEEIGSGFDVVMCSCGWHCWTNESLFAHWEAGHFDEDIYEDIKSDKEIKIINIESKDDVLKVLCSEEGRNVIMNIICGKEVVGGIVNEGTIYKEFK